MRVGHYEPRVQKKGKQESFLPDISEGGTYWQIQIDKHTQMDVGSQINAEIISRLIRIENLLRNKKK